MTTLTPEIETLALPAGFEWRAMRREDVPAWYATLVAIDQADGRTSAGSLADQQSEFGDTWYDPSTDTLIAVAPDGTVAAYARVLTNPEPGPEAPAHLIEDTHPAYRGRGLEEAVLAWAEARGRERLRQLAAEHPGERRYTLRGTAVDTRHERLRLYAARGFRHVRYFFRMRRDLGEPIPELPPPAGLRVERYTPARSEGLRQALNEAFTDHWGHEPVSLEDWEMFFVGHSSFRPDLTLVALDGEQVAGFSLCKVRPDDNARGGVEQAWIGDLAVRRPWRKRGLGSALVAGSLRAFAAAGFPYAALGVDAENLTGALAIYERLGFRAYQRFVALEKTTKDEGRTTEDGGRATDVGAFDRTPARRMTR